MPQLTGLQLRTLIRKNGELELSLKDTEVGPVGPDEVVVRVEAAPINPSDLGLLIGPADMAKAKVSGSSNLPIITAPVPAAFMRAMAARIDQSLPAGNEGAGVVVDAGASPGAQALIGKTVALFGGALYAQYRKAKAADCLALPEGVTAAEGAACFVNPLTALGMVGTMRMEGHTGLVHTAAASNLGQMLVKICLRDGVPLVNVVRKPEQAALLRGLGATHVVDSSSPGFMDELIAAVGETGATIGFDAIGGGKLAGQILTAMEVAAAAKAGGSFNRYGSGTHKQLYIYGGLDMGPTELSRAFGFATTFASHFTRTVSLAGALSLDAIAVYNKRATGEKYLVDPSLD
jgi:NADPH:quinone reductase-like Zn-dependent oxidoreductase